MARHRLEIHVSHRRRHGLWIPLYRRESARHQIANSFKPPTSRSLKLRSSITIAGQTYAPISGPLCGKQDD